MEGSIRALSEKIAKLEIRLSHMATVYVAFVIGSDQEATEFLKSASAIISAHDRYQLVCSHEGKIEFGDIIVDFTASPHWQEIIQTRPPVYAQPMVSLAPRGMTLRLLKNLLRYLVLIFKLKHYRNFDKIDKKMLDFDQYKQVKEREW